MSALHAAVALHPRLCSRCGKCLRACPKGLVTMNSGFVCIDLATCDGCFACGSVCEAGAITAGKPLRSASLKPPGADSAELAVVPKGVADTDTKAATSLAARPAAEDAREVPAGTVGWTMVEAAAVASVLFAALLAKDMVVGHQAFALIPAQWKTAAFMLVLALFYIVQVATLTFLAQRHGWLVSRVFKSPTRDIRGAVVSSAMVVGLLLAARIASTAWGALLRAVGWQPPGEAGVLNEIFGAGQAGVVLVFLMAVVIGPTVEELVFRGVIASAIRNRWGLAAGVLVSAALFAAYHVQPWLYVQMFVLGCALAWLALTRRTLWPAVVLHALYNAVSVVVWLLS